MKKKYLIRIAAAACMALAVLGVLWLMDKSSTAQPASIRHVKTGDFNIGGYISYGDTFWVTNHTSKALQIHSVAVEVKVGSNWVTQSSNMRMLEFRIRGKSKKQMNLKAHEAGYTTFTDLPLQPVGTRWRLRAMVYEESYGIAEIWVRLKYIPRQIKYRWRTGQGMWFNPFAKNFSVVDSLGEIVSPAIREE